MSEFVWWWWRARPDMIEARLEAFDSCAAICCLNLIACDAMGARAYLPPSVAEDQEDSGTLSAAYSCSSVDPCAL